MAGAGAVQGERRVHAEGRNGTHRKEESRLLMDQGHRGSEVKSERREKTPAARKKEAEGRCRYSRDGGTKESVQRRKGRVTINDKAKKDAWSELVRSIDDDPWGRPYRTVLGRLRAAVAPLTTMGEEELKRTVRELFPAVSNVDVEREERRTLAATRREWREENAVTMAELTEATKRPCRKRTDPGPDGIHGTVLGTAMPVLGPRVLEAFNVCLREETFPEMWKEANLALIPKSGKPGKFRPICMLGETGRLFERIIANRITGHLESVGLVGGPVRIQERQMHAGRAKKSAGVRDV